MTGKICEVKGFHDRLEVIKTIPVVTNATAWTDTQSGATYILIYNKSLTFKNDMYHLLINPNQLRPFGILVWDNPYDSECTIDIYTGEFFIQFQTEGSTIFFDTHFTSDFEL